MQVGELGVGHELVGDHLRPDQPDPNDGDVDRRARRSSHATGASTTPRMPVLQRDDAVGQGADPPSQTPQPRDPIQDGDEREERDQHRTDVERELEAVGRATRGGVDHVFWSVVVECVPGKRPWLCRWRRPRAWPHRHRSRDRGPRPPRSRSGSACRGSRRASSRPAPSARRASPARSRGHRPGSRESGSSRGRGPPAPPSRSRPGAARRTSCWPTPIGDAGRRSRTRSPRNATYAREDAACDRRHAARHHGHQLRLRRERLDVGLDDEGRLGLAHEDVGAHGERSPARSCRARAGRRTTTARTITCITPR